MGEVVGLKWSTIDLFNKTITIRHTVTSGSLNGKLHQLAIYKLNQSSYHDTINYILEYLSIAVHMNVYKEFITTTAMYEKVRKLATTEQQQQYENIIKGVLTNEKSIGGYVPSSCAF